MVRTKVLCLAKRTRKKGGLSFGIKKKKERSGPSFAQGGRIEIW